MDSYSGKITRLAEQFASLPGIGAKSAQRLAFHIVSMPEENVSALAEAILDARRNIRFCKYCCTLTDEEVCPICASDKRDHSTIMVVENARDLAAYEKTGRYEGVYHVLQGAISPAAGVGPNEIRLYKPGDGHGHESDFIDGIYENRPIATDCEIGHRSISACHIANICERLGLSTLKWDPAAERFAGTNADAANALLEVKHHNGWSI